jgi:hypothetical protein
LFAPVGLFNSGQQTADVCFRQMRHPADLVVDCHLLHS